MRDAFKSINKYCHAMEEGLYCPTEGMDKIENEFDEAYEVLDNEPKSDKKEAA